MNLRVSAPHRHHWERCSCGCLFLSPSVEGTGNTGGEEIEPAEASSGMCQCNCSVGSLSPCTSCREGPEGNIPWGCRGSRRKVRSSQGCSKGHPRLLC